MPEAEDRQAYSVNIIADASLHELHEWRGSLHACQGVKDGIVYGLDGTMLAAAVTTGIGTRSGLLSVVALHSRDAGYTFEYTGVLASIDEVPYAHEGPSENALAHLSNGSIICIMRVDHCAEVELVALYGELAIADSREERRLLGDAGRWPHVEAVGAAAYDDWL